MSEENVAQCRETGPIVKQELTEPETKAETAQQEHENNEVKADVKHEICTFWADARKYKCELLDPKCEEDFVKEENCEEMVNSAVNDDRIMLPRPSISDREKATVSTNQLNFGTKRADRPLLFAVMSVSTVVSIKANLFDI